MMYRSTGSGYSRDKALSSPSQGTGGHINSRNYLGQEQEKVAYELGLSPGEGLSGEDQQRVQNRLRLRDLERQLGSYKEREQYSRVLPWLQSDSERIEMLSIPTLEGRQAWINKKNIWGRAKSPDFATKEMIETQDISIGMPQEYVKKSWGDPMAVEVSGNPIYKNERWKYVRQVPSSEGFRREVRYVYFEGGRVVGWETN